MAKDKKDKDAAADKSKKTPKPSPPKPPKTHAAPHAPPSCASTYMPSRAGGAEPAYDARACRGKIMGSGCNLYKSVPAHGKASGWAWTLVGHTLKCSPSATARPAGPTKPAATTPLYDPSKDPVVNDSLAVGTTKPYDPWTDPVVNDRSWTGGSGDYGPLPPLYLGGGVGGGGGGRTSVNVSIKDHDAPVTRWPALPPLVLPPGSGVPGVPPGAVPVLTTPTTAVYYPTPMLGTPTLDLSFVAPWQTQVLTSSSMLAGLGPATAPATQAPIFAATDAPFDAPTDAPFADAGGGGGWGWGSRGTLVLGLLSAAVLVALALLYARAHRVVAAAATASVAA